MMSLHRIDRAETTNRFWKRSMCHRISDAEWLPERGTTNLVQKSQLLNRLVLWSWAGPFSEPIFRISSTIPTRRCHLHPPVPNSCKGRWEWVEAARVWDASAERFPARPSEVKRFGSKAKVQRRVVPKATDSRSFVDVLSQPKMERRFQDGRGARDARDGGRDGRSERDFGRGVGGEASVSPGIGTQRKGGKHSSTFQSTSRFRERGEEFCWSEASRGTW